MQVQAPGGNAVSLNHAHASEEQIPVWRFMRRGHIPIHLLLMDLLKEGICQPSACEPE